MFRNYNKKFSSKNNLPVKEILIILFFINNELLIDIEKGIYQDTTKITGMQVKITGSSGYLGRIIASHLREKGITVSATDRNMLYGPTEILAGEIRNADALINLAGAPILQRWTKKNRKIIYNSRIKTVEKLVKAIQYLPQSERPKKIISASAIGIYRSGEVHDESSTNYDTGFLGNLVKDWESAWGNLPEEVRLTIFRIAVVLGRESATIKKMLLPFKFGLGGKIGNGKQPFPFVHETDLFRAFTLTLEDDSLKGTFNLAAPQQITNEEFTGELAGVLHRPAFIPVPVIALRLLYGNAASLLADSPAVIPRALTEKGFEFKFPNIKSALDEIIKR
jgi:uncharacterized protein (TIGR01777 family)